MRRNLQQDESQSNNYVAEHNLRVLSFGSSRTWGAGMSNRTTEAFPGLLNKNLNDNKAVCGSDANYPAMCTYSMVGKYAIYDIITIEYPPMSVLNTQEPIKLLTRRLQHRFPDAIIIVLNVWTLHQFFHKPTGKGLRQFMLDNTSMMEPNNPHIPQGALEEVLAKTSSKDWIFADYDADAVLGRIANQVDGTVLTLDAPNMEDPINSMLKVAPMYFTDMSHFSKLGHEWVKDRVAGIVQYKQKIEPSDRADLWESTDLCLSWYENGDTEGAVGTNMPMKAFASPTGRRYGLEASNTKALNFIELTNTDSNPQHLYLSHMVTGPEKLYPTETIANIHPTIESLHQQSNTTTATTTNRVVQTWFQETPPQSAIHAVNHRYIGVVPPGKSFLNLKATPEDENTSSDPFRAVGIMLSPAAFVDKVEALF